MLDKRTDRNRRRAVRMDIDRDAQITAPDGSIERPCKLRNLSARGAKLTLIDHADLPERVVLHVPADGTAWPCRIVRRRESEIGVLFV